MTPIRIIRRMMKALERMILRSIFMFLWPSAAQTAQRRRDFGLLLAHWQVPPEPVPDEEQAAEHEERVKQGEEAQTEVLDEAEAEAGERDPRPNEGKPRPRAGVNRAIAPAHRALSGKDVALPGEGGA